MCVMLGGVEEGWRGNRGRDLSEMREGENFHARDGGGSETGRGGAEGGKRVIFVCVVSK